MLYERMEHVFVWNSLGNALIIKNILWPINLISLAFVWNSSSSFTKDFNPHLYLSHPYPDMHTF